MFASRRNRQSTTQIAMMAINLQRPWSHLEVEWRSHGCDFAVERSEEAALRALMLAVAPLEMRRSRCRLTSSRMQRQADQKIESWSCALATSLPAGTLATVRTH